MRTSFVPSAVALAVAVALACENAPPQVPADDARIAPSAPPVGPRCGRAPFATYDPRVREPVRWLALGDKAQASAPARNATAQSDVGRDPERHLAALSALVDEADAAVLSNASPVAVVLPAGQADPTRTRASLTCLLDRYAAEIARARTVAPALVRGLEEGWIGLRLASDLFELGHERRCEAGACPADEICVMPCIPPLPVTPAPPDCWPIPPGARPERACATLGTGCASCTVSGRSASCGCPKP